MGGSPPPPVTRGPSPSARRSGASWSATVRPGILREILLFCMESAKWRLDRLRLRQCKEPEDEKLWRVVCRWIELEVCRFHGNLKVGRLSRRTEWIGEDGM
jgi:hypothetical protein